MDEIAEPGSFILYDESFPQSYRSYNSVFTNDWFHFKPDKDDQAFLNGLEIPRNRPVPIGDLHELSLMVNQLSYETYASNRFKSETIGLLLKLFFIKLSNKIHDCSLDIANGNYNKMSIIRSKIYNQPFKPWTIAEMSHELTMSRSNLQHLYKRFFGVSPIDDVIASRMEHAKYLLSTTNIAVKKIAEMCGYNNEIHFMRQFKKATAVTPSEYRANKGGQNP
ncbi:helix-turn-helix transcriptional regulator [Cohnella faecalis]|uniref:AraC family transcriptional regulator n=1 Tax=Cohnella faecalis TaxID=2315694 RepID=A0A398CCE2_9BACL|nr:AraC family transcriptional regulator [Cohnella faecalis]RIE00390.1 AraC family transcriptional regulator [Cohnella faecalis]